MSTGWLIFLLGVLAGGLCGMVAGRLWGYRNGHLDGYQDHRDEVRELRNSADAAAAASPLEVRAKTGPLPRLPAPMLTDRWASISAVPGGGRPFPPASPRTHTTAADIGPVAVPAADTLPAAKPRESITADQAETLIREIIAGTWP